MVFGIGIVLAILAALPAMAVAAENVSYFDPQHSSAETDGYEKVTIYFNLSEGTRLAGSQLQLQFDPEHVDIPDGYVLKGCTDPPTAEGQHCWEALDTNYGYTSNGYMWIVLTGPQEAVYKPFPIDKWEYVTIPYFDGPMTVKMCDIYVVANATGTPGVSRFDFGFEEYPPGCAACDESLYADKDAVAIDVTWVNGTFTHIAETYETTLEPGWNLISLPLTNETDMKVANIINKSLGGNYNALYKYNASTHNFVPLNSSGQMEKGVGYFIHMTTGDTWTYTGTPCKEMNIPLKEGLNMVGWLNSSKPINDALSSIEGNYWYVARWNATSQKFETYNPVAPNGFNDFSDMERGEGYFISAKGADTLSESC